MSCKISPAACAHSFGQLDAYPHTSSPSQVCCKPGVWLHFRAICAMRPQRCMREQDSITCVWVSHNEGGLQACAGYFQGLQPCLLPQSLKLDQGPCYPVVNAHHPLGLLGCHQGLTCCKPARQVLLKPSDSLLKNMHSNIPLKGGCSWPRSLSHPCIIVHNLPDHLA